MLITSEFDILKSCPFCGGKAKIAVEDHPNIPESIYAYVFCEECHAKTTGSMTGKDYKNKYITFGKAVSTEMNRWNKRSQKIDKISPMEGGVLAWMK